jgi:PAS domain S-box-containing protein
MGLKELLDREYIPEDAKEQIRESERALRDAEQKWNALTQNSGNITMIIDSESVIQEIINPVPPYTPEDVAGKSVYEFIPEEQHDISKNALKKAFEEGRPANFEISSDVPQAGRMWFRTNVIPVKDKGKVTKVIQIVRDITEQKKVEDALRESEERHKALFEGSADGILVADIETKQFRYTNKVICTMLGYSKEELMGMRITDIHPEESLESVISEIKAQEEGRETRAVNIPCRKKDGTIIYTSISAQKSIIGGRECHVGFFRDLTEHRKFEEKLAEAQKMDSIGNLAGGIAHDFNNLLAGVLGYTDLLLMTETDPERKEDLQRVKQAAVRASALTQQLLAFGRRGKHLIQPINLNDVVKEVYSILEATIDKSIKLETNLEKNLCLIEGDPSQINQVVMNVCVNAKDAMPKGGTMTVQTQILILDDMFCKTHPETMPGKYVLLSVNDTGYGMTKEIQKRIFEPFFSTKTNDEIKHSGLGLATVYGIVRNHRGIVDVYSEAGEGTTFKIYLPAGEKELEVETAQAEEIRKGEGRILIVEDEEAVRAMAQKLLKHLGYSVVTARDGQEGVEVYREMHKEIDAVILDMIMPRMGGRDTFIRMKEINPDIKALLSTGYAQNGKAQEIIDMGVKGFLQKPYQVKDMAQKLGQVLKK